MGVGIDEEGGRRRLGHALRHGHGFGRRGALVEQRGIGDGQARHVDDHLLVVQQRLKAALAHLSLIGRVGGVPARVLQDVAQDYLGRDGAVVAHADHRGEHLVAAGGLAQIGERGALRHRLGKVEGALGADLARHHLVDEVVEGAGPHRLQHGCGFRLIGADVAANEIGAGLEVLQRNTLVHDCSLTCPQTCRRRRGPSCRRAGRDWRS